jgi:hypothetical protein
VVARGGGARRRRLRRWHSGVEEDDEDAVGFPSLPGMLTPALAISPSSPGVSGQRRRHHQAAAHRRRRRRLLHPRQLELARPDPARLREPVAMKK